MDHQGTTYPSIARQTLPKCNNCITKYSHPVCFSSNERINENMLYQKSGSLFQNLDLRPTILLTPGLHLWNPGGLQDSDPGSRYILSRPLRVVFFYFESSSSRVVVKSPSTESSNEQQQQILQIHLMTIMLHLFNLQIAAHLFHGRLLLNIRIDCNHPEISSPWPAASE